MEIRAPSRYQLYGHKGPKSAHVCNALKVIHTQVWFPSLLARVPSCNTGWATAYRGAQQTRIHESLAPQIAQPCDFTDDSMRRFCFA
jgi:hypothetical protein